MGLLVGLSVGLVVLAAGSALLANHLRGHRMALQDSHLHHDLRSAMDWMARELRKAQYTAQAWQTRAPSVCQDEFCDDPMDFQIQGSRIDFRYDRNHNGRLDNNECLGFRLSKGALQARTSCSPEVWTALSDTASLQIKELNWKTRCQNLSGWLRRSVDIELHAQWPGEPQRSFTLSQTVHLRNDLPASAQALFCP